MDPSEDRTSPKTLAVPTSKKEEAREISDVAEAPRQAQEEVYHKEQQDEPDDTLEYGEVTREEQPKPAEETTSAQDYPYTPPILEHAYGRGARGRMYTEKGLSYEAELRRKQLTSAIRRWRNKMNEAQEILADSEDEKEIRKIRQELSLCMSELQEAFDNDQALDSGDPLTIDEFETKHNQILSIIGETLRDIRSEKRSQRPSKRSSKSSTSRSVHSMKVEGAAKKAELETKLRLMDSGLEAQLQSQKRKLERLETMKELALTSFV